MISPGLVSITFRQLSPAEIVRLVVQAGLQGIEWGGDVHVPHGDLARAREVRGLTADVGLVTAAYGSYYRLGHSETDGLPFERVLETAVALEAPTVRVWAGTRGAAEADADYRKLIIDESRRIADIAAAAGITVSYEYHGGTLTDTPASALDLLEQAAHPNLKTLWQPLNWQPTDEATRANVQSLRQVLPWLTNVHVYHWVTDEAGQRERRSLAAGEASWREYLRTISATGRDHWALIEFVRHDTPEEFLEDAQALREWLGD
ncbi:MAG: sugar phosphate isomerase/epimerase [Armatimonadota bacterium]|nr:sugar phosphate isomerase/epimerase [Armatimonadota bacterium]